MGDLLQAYNDGGFFMHTILASSLVGIAITVERFIVLLAAANINKNEVLKRINHYILKGRLDEAISAASQTRAPLARIIRAGLVAVKNQGESEEVQTAMDAVALREVPRLEKRIGLLATLSNIATLLGLLGTVTGLIGAFAAVANVAPAEKATMLSNSIAMAMNTTAFGLVVAIPLLGFFGYLNNLAQGIIDDMHESAVATLNFILSNKGKF
ncbi:MAG: MotA/TolQ/ExbB proton channel family protein [Bdellovibrionaceae bacterium]|jgi:biopolymer transport protein ExbB|nr:MotA/TolQ/ExbB proton channel family protein [Pseudobdellovibrionaceae bacterium]